MKKTTCSPGSRLVALVCTLLLLCTLVPFSRARPAAEGYWRQTGRQDFYCPPNQQKTVRQGDYSSVWSTNNTASETSFTSQSKLDGDYWSGGKDYVGGTISSATAEFSPPQTRYGPGETVSVQIRTAVSATGPGKEEGFVVGMQADACIIGSSVSFEEIVAHYCGGSWGDATMKRPDGGSIYPDSTKSQAFLVADTMPEEGQPGEKLCIRYNASAGSFAFSNQNYGTVWEYEWIGNAPVSGETDPESPGDKNPESEDWFDDDAVIDPTDIYTDPLDEPYAEQAISVPALVAVAAAAGAALIGGRLVLKKRRHGAPPPRNHPDSPAEESPAEQLSSSYELRVQKEFGDTITPGESLFVFARMVEITPDGLERSAPDLSRKIRIYGNGYLQAEQEAMNGEFQSARVTAPPLEDCPEQAELIFDFAGVYRVHMQFKIGHPYITFPDRESLTAVAGDGCDYQFPFLLEDFTALPEHIDFVCDDPGLSVTAEQVDGWLYTAHIRNHTQPMENKISWTETRLRVEIRAVTRGLTVSRAFHISLYPEGLSIKGSKRDNMLLVPCREDKDAGPMDYRIKPTGFIVVLAVKEIRPDGSMEVSLPPVDRIGLELGRLTAQDTFAANMLKTYPWHVDYSNLHNGWCCICPEKHLPAYYTHEDIMRLNPIHYQATGRLSCSWHNQTYSMELPITFLGEVIQPAAAWEEEYQRVVRAIRKYLPEELQAEQLKQLEERKKMMGTLELRFMEKSLIREANRRYVELAAAEEDWIAALDWMIWGAEWAKWAGDIAFSYLATYFTGPMGEAILTPMKDLTVSLLAELIGAGCFKFDCNLPDAVQSAFTIVENLLCTYLNLGDNPVRGTIEFRKAGMAIAFFFVMRILSNYHTKYDPNAQTPYSLWDALFDATCDLTTKSMQLLAGAGLSNMLNSQKFQRAMASKAGTWLQKNVYQKMQNVFQESYRSKGKLLDLPFEIRKDLLKRYPQLELRENASLPAEVFNELVSGKNEALQKLWEDWFEQMLVSGWGQNMLDGLLGAGVSYIVPALRAVSGDDKIEPLAVTHKIIRQESDFVCSIPVPNPSTGNTIIVELNLSAALRNGSALFEMMWDLIFWWVPDFGFHEPPSDLPDHPKQR